MLKKNIFFNNFNITEESFKETGLDWETLVEIYNNYVTLAPFLEEASEKIVKNLINLTNVHSVRKRVKKPEHLIEKIIRKGAKYKSKNINVTNYREIITDLIGIRVLHLFKDDWHDVHFGIKEIWPLLEVPQINIRRGDYNLEKLEKNVDNLGCEIVVRDHGYRSIHYLIGILLEKDLEIRVEIQVRTVFEEAWSEIDHITRYPYDMDNELLVEYLAILNRIVGSADEMGTLIKKIKTKLSNKKENENRELDNKFY